jgi:REP-associated tyrosine transposase
MARLARVVVRGIPHHIIQRGNRRQPVFFRDDDYLAYLNLMQEWCQKERVVVWAYCLMPNHIHLICVPDKTTGLARAVGEAHRRYTRLINFREGWRGYLWQGRFASYPMAEDHLSAALRYVELNPVRAHLAKDPGAYPWSSARAHLEGRDDLLVKSQPLAERIGNWQEFLSQGNANWELETIRGHLRTGRPLGDRQFLADLEKKLRRALIPRKPGPTPKTTRKRRR